VDSTEDIKHVVARCVEGAFTFSGQVCISIQRIYVKNRLYKEFLSQFINEVKKLKVGNPADENTDISALISKDEVSRLDKWIEEAVSQGAVIQQGGKMDDSILRPTVLTGASKELSVNCREAFGPVVTVESYEEIDEAIDKVNDSDYGLQAGVFTKEISKAFKAVDKLEVGGVIVNDIPSFRVDNMPYGGIKESGTGREGVRYSMEEMNELKFASINL